MLVVSYVIDLYCSWLCLVWKSGHHGLIVNIDQGELSDTVEGIDMLGVDCYVRISDMSPLREGAIRVGLGNFG